MPLRHWVQMRLVCQLFQEELNHEEVVEVTERVKGDFKGLLKAILAEL